MLHRSSILMFRETYKNIHYILHLEKDRVNLDHLMHVINIIIKSYVFGECIHVSGYLYFVVECFSFKFYFKT